PCVAGARDGASAPVQAAAAAAGAHVRAGLEDSVVLPDGAAATSSAQLVERAVRLGEALGRPPMGPDDARLLIR
ncbi:MAG: 3-keto-5-aminohexanoate cleavage protein, partial [Actinomycetota bacterium]